MPSGAPTSICCRTACQRLEVSPLPPGDHVPQAEIYRAEAGLRERGLDVRAAATR